MYLIKNCLPNDNESILILDLKAKTVFPIKKYII
jgi:hypothetical protein